MLSGRMLKSLIITVIITNVSIALFWILAALFSASQTYTQDSLDGGSARRQGATYRTAQTYNKHTQTYLLRAGFKLKTPAFERAKTVHALDLATSLMGIGGSSMINFLMIT
jgi:hypothetical protein